MTPEQKKAYRRAHYLKNKEKSHADTKAWKAANPLKARAWARLYQQRTGAIRRQKVRDLITAEKAKPCADCGHQYPHYVMDFDHVRGEKIAAVGTMLRNPSVRKVLDEISKCDVVCANCHRIRTYTRGSRKLLPDALRACLWNCPQCERGQLAKLRADGTRRCRWCKTAA